MKKQTKAAPKPKPSAKQSGLGARLRSARLAAGIETVDELARMLKIPTPTLYEIEAGVIQRSSHTPKIAAGLGLHAMWLATGQGPREIGGSSLDGQAGVAHRLQQATGVPLTPELSELIALYTATGPEGKEMIRQLAKQTAKLGKPATKGRST